MAEGRTDMQADMTDDLSVFAREEEACREGKSNGVEMVRVENDW